ncbi:YadA-like family protein [Escherichia ruysiae]|uniref:YadA-like family protein n=3 Tax=unclassified Escherichia TaxID=2608889 RepID=UPI000D3B748C|nr:MULTISPECIES: YadA-like family protein [Escherichia]EFK3892258.1 adhesin [Escherichia coli]MBA0989174.1 YadA-like family protein [Escherichia coli]MBY7284031.1 YadA-like family protein [Escherichia ruysiae]PTN22811.1 adhesin [Escherichia sp. MOD1-EC6475]
MKTVKMSLLAVVIATAVSPSAFAGDTIEAAATELEAIQPGMSHEEVDQKIGRFMIRTGNTEAAQDYLFSHGYISSETGENISPEQTQADRDAAQDTAIQNAQTTANTAVSTANEAHQAITSAQTEIDASKAAIHKNTDDIIEQKNILRAQQDQINDTQKTVAATGDVQNTARYQSMVNARQEAADIAQQQQAETQQTQITEQQKQIEATQKTVAATGDVQNAARYQSMVNARQEAADNAQQQQAEAQQTQITEQQKQIEATQKTVAATGDVQTAARYQSMVNAKLAAENEASTRASAEQGKKIDALSSTMTTVSQSVATENHTKELEEIHGDITKTNTAVSKLAAQQQIDSVHYGEQIQNLVQDSTDTHQQLSTTQKRVADNSQQINTLNNHFSSLKNEVEDNRKDANAGIASAIAIASQPQVKTGDLMMVSAGAGTFNGESAVSVGTSFNAGIHTVIKAGVSADTQSDFGAGVGVGYSF